MSTPNGRKTDVAVLGWWYGKNYGSILTYYGLNRAIVGLGHTPLMVHEPLGYNGYRVKWPDDILSMKFARRVGYIYTEQAHYSENTKLNNVATTFVVGSDQLWNPHIGRVNDDLFLDFVSSENKRVAYGTSFGNRGTSKFKPDFVEKHSENLGKFDAISVREAYAIDTARDIFGVKATQVVDPVFLLPKSDYDTLADKATTKVDGDYLAVFLLDATLEKKQVAEAIADKLGLDKIVIIPNPDEGRSLAESMFTESRFEILPEDAPENFLHAYRNARYVVTDSFHGSAFAIIFEKPFSSIYNKKRGVDRFVNLLTSLGFGETRRVFETDDAKKIQDNVNVSFKVDFSESCKRIAVDQAKSLQWLKTALQPKSKSETETKQSTNGRVASFTKSIKSPVFPNNDKPASEHNVVSAPTFTSNNGAWSVEKESNFSLLRVAPGAAIRGNLVWCDLPFTLQKSVAYRLKVSWALNTVTSAINLHIRNSQTTKFKVIGTIKRDHRSKTQRTDEVEFISLEDGFDQFMLGAIHFPGSAASLKIYSIQVEEIAKGDVKVQQKKGPTHAEIALKLALDDNERFTKAHKLGRSIGATVNARARLMFHAHAVEKGLSRIDFRVGFGKIAVPGLAKEMNAWLAAGGSTEDPIFMSGASAMRSYLDRHAENKFDVSEFFSLFSPENKEIISNAPMLEGGVLAAANDREVPLQKNVERRFIDVVYGRRSVRDFTDKPVNDSDIQAAVQIAMQAPSVCNRQSVRVHMFDNKKTMQAALDLQGGFGGYKMPPKLLLITSDLNSFLFAAERRQPFIDGGLFMMNLLLGLEQVGLGGCSLNTAMNTERENAIRKILNIPDHEVFIAFIATGHYDPAVLVPRSKRISVEDVLISHTN